MLRFHEERKSLSVLREFFFSFSFENIWNILKLQKMDSNDDEADEVDGVFNMVKYFESKAISEETDIQDVMKTDAEGAKCILQRVKYFENKNADDAIQKEDFDNSRLVPNEKVYGPI